MESKVSLAFAKLADPALITFVDHVLERMKNNAAFPTPDPTLASIQTAVSLFQDKLAAAKGGERLKTAEKNAAREALLGKMRLLALYVQQESNGDLPTLLSSGYEAQKERTPVGVLPAPETVTLTQGPRSGELSMRAKPVPNAASYITQWTTDPTAPDAWQNNTYSSSSRVTIKGLPPGTRFWVRVSAVGSSGQGAWSEPVAAYVI